MLFSATMPQEIMSIANSYMKLPVRVEVAPQGTAAALVTQELYFVQRDNKLSLLENILKEYHGSVLVFTRTKFGAKKLANSIRKMSFTSAEIHSNRSLNQRLEALNGFKLGKYRVMVATDIAARGIDVTGIELVLNYDLPEQAADYVHRIGRTGRAEHLGHAISFATPDQKFDVRAIEKLIKKQLPVTTTPNLPKRAPEAPDRSFEQRRPQINGGFTGFGRTPNRNARESFGKRGRFHNSPKPAPLRSPFAKRTKPLSHFRPNGPGSNHGQTKFARTSRDDSQF